MENTILILLAIFNIYFLVKNFNLKQREGIYKKIVETQQKYIEKCESKIESFKLNAN